MFFIENEEEYERAVNLLESLYETYRQPTGNMVLLQEAIVDWELKNNPEDLPLKKAVDEIL